MKNEAISFRVAVFWSYLTQYGQTAITFLSTVVLARLLLPEEIGIYSAGFVLIGYASLLRDFGVSNYLVQEQELSARKIQTALTFNNLLGWILGAAVFFSADAAAGFYDEPKVADVFKILAINFLIVPLGSVTFAILRKEMRFKELAKIQLIAVATTASVSVCSAVVGASHTSMAYGAVAGSLCTAALCNFYRDRAVPLKVTLAEFSSLWSYCSHSVGLTLARHTSQSSAEIFTGKFLGMAEVAFLSKSIRLPTMCSQLITNGLKSVALPSMSKLANNRDELTKHYLWITEFTLGLALPALAFLGIHADTAVLILFGENWTSIIPLLQIACVSGAFGLLSVYAEDMLKATGQISKLSRVEPYILASSIIILGLGATQSLVTLLWCITILSLFRATIRSLLLAKYLGIKLTTQAISAHRSLVLLALFLTIQILTRLACNQEYPYLCLAISTLVAAISWLLLVKALSHPIYTRYLKGHY